MTIKPYTNNFVTILVHFNEVIPDKLFFWSVIHGGHLEFKCDLDLDYRKYYHYLREHMNSLSKRVIPSILDTYNQIIREKHHYFIDLWLFFFFYMAFFLYFSVPGPLMLFLRLAHNRALSQTRILTSLSPFYLKDMKEFEMRCFLECDLWRLS